MTHTLMHKDIPVADLTLDESTGSIQRIDALLHGAHLPVGVSIRHGVADRAALNEWWEDRSIPASRSGLREALETLGVASLKLLLTRCYGLSLSDHYWIKPADSELTWRNVNFFENPFSEDVGDALFGIPPKKEGFDFSSPDNTTDGFLKKRWKILDRKCCLIKAGSPPFLQQPFNEVIAAKIAERLGILHISYTLLWDDEVLYSVCEDFVTPDTELIPAWRVMQIQKKENQTSVYQHYRNCCEALGVPNVAHALDQMIVLDYLIANEDRHLNNVGLLRNPDTLEWLVPAPIYDSGSSLGCDKVTAQIRSGRNITCKPFKKTHKDQLRLVTSFDWLDLSKLQGIDRDIREVFTGADEYVDRNRVEAIAASVNQRIQMMETFVLTQQPQVDSTENDVEEDVAAEYEIKFPAS
ncbi:putative uncharacterized protein [Clostridium sp. CAG:1013]|nr:putative uncharacterized protein [Clostridium sp. CAG:1013]